MELLGDHDVLDTAGGAGEHPIPSTRSGSVVSSVPQFLHWLSCMPL